jgi:Tfp pilus assembly protein PilF
MKHRFLLAALACLVTLQAGAAARLPVEDGEVLERLPLKRDDVQAAALRELRARAAAAPHDADTAVALGRQYFSLAMAYGDPRYIGYAQATLRPWAGEATAPAEILLVRAMLLQYRHEFDAALDALAAALRQDPASAEAHAWRAAVLMVRADYEAAARECDALVGLADELQATGCRAYVEATTGRARAAYDRLNEALSRSPQAGRGLRLWTLTRLAEIAWRLGDAAAAERHFREALALDVTDNFLLADYADFLLEQRRAREAADLLSGWEQSDTLLLRLALAERALGRPEAKRHARVLGERFAAAALRGERLHLAEESRYLLELRGDAAAALSAAAENWTSQREPRDARALLEAARAAQRPAAAAPVLEWLRRSGFEDARLGRLAAELR